MKFRVAVLTISLLCAGIFTQRAIAVGTNNRLSNGWIVQIEGNVELQRQDGRKVRGIVGMPLFPGDRLSAPNGNAIVQCLDLSWQEVRTGEAIANRCRDVVSQTQKCSDTSVKCPHRGDRKVQRYANIPYIISPRRTHLFTSTPHLRWNRVSDTKEYRVILQGDGVEVWRTTVTEPEVVYPGVPQLQPGINYRLRVDTDGGMSSLDAPVLQGGIQFQVLNPEKQAQLLVQKAEIEQKSLDSIGETLALAQLYFTYDLVAEGIEQLESVVSQGVQGASLYRELADRYFFRLDLLPTAQVYYETAYQQVSPEDLEEKTAIAYGLSQVYRTLGDRAQTLHWLSEAEQGYQELRDFQRLEMIRKQLRILQN